MQLKSVIRPTVLFAAGSFASGAHAAAVDIAASDAGTPIYLFGSQTAQFTYDIDPTTSAIGTDTAKAYLKSAPGTADVTRDASATTFPTASSTYVSQVAMFDVDEFRGVSVNNPVGIRVTDGSGVVRYGRVTGDIATQRITDITIDGVPNASVTTSVPEPATWATAILGLGMAGAAARRRRRQQPALAAAA